MRLSVYQVCEVELCQHFVGGILCTRACPRNLEGPLFKQIKFADHPPFSISLYYLLTLFPGNFHPSGLLITYTASAFCYGIF